MAEVAHVAPHTWPIGAPVAVGVWALSVATWTSVGESPPGRSLWATAVGVAGGGWLAWASTVGPSHGLGALAAGTVIAAFPRWARHPVPVPALEPIELPAPKEAPQIEVFQPERTYTQLHWELVVAGAGGALPGSILVDPAITGTYERYVIQLRAGGQHTTASAIAAAVRVAAAFGQSMSNVTIEPHPTGDQSRAVLTMSTANPLADNVRYPGPLQALDMTDGIRAWFGQHPDGSPLWWRFYRPDWGACHGAVFGDTRTGKSELLTSIGLSAMHSKLITVIPGCPQGGKSFPDLIKHGHWPARSPEQILTQARGLNAALTMRSQIGGLRGGKIHVPTEDEPLLLWIVDEFHEVCTQGSELAEIADRIARQGAKDGIALIAADQNPALPTFANLNTLRRSLLAAGNGVCLRLGSNGANQMLPGLLVNPAELPRVFPDGSPTSGVGYRVDDPVVLRVGRVVDSARHAADAPEGRVEKATASAMGADYTDRHTKDFATRAAQIAHIAQHDPDLAVSLIGDDVMLADGVRFARAEMERRAREAANPPAEPVSPSSPAATFTIPAAPTLRIVGALEPKGTAVDEVHRLLVAGVTRTGDLLAQARRPDGKPYGETQIRNALETLKSTGRARRIGHGEHHAA